MLTHRGIWQHQTYTCHGQGSVQVGGTIFARLCACQLFVAERDINSKERFFSTGTGCNAFNACTAFAWLSPPGLCYYLPNFCYCRFVCMCTGPNWPELDPLPASELAALLMSHAIHIMPSEREGFGHSINEGRAAGEAGCVHLMSPACARGSLTVANLAQPHATFYLLESAAAPACDI